jgi:hypothetical protein
LVPFYLADGTTDSSGYADSASTDRTRSHALRKRDHSALVGRTPQSTRRPVNKEAWWGGKNADKAVSSAVGQT